MVGIKKQGVALVGAFIVGRSLAFVVPLNRGGMMLQQQHQSTSTSWRNSCPLTSSSSSCNRKRVLQATPAVSTEAKGKGHGGGGHGHGGMGGVVDPNSFVQTELRKEAMKLHTRDQSKEGEQEAQTPFTAWQPERQDYLQFLVDSKLVYETFDELVGGNAKLSAFRNTGLERAGPLAKDIEWFAKTYPNEVKVPEVGPYGKAYAAFVKEVAARSLPAFICHYYNFYFAHTAGGRMIGKKMASLLLDGHELHFYQWEGDVKEKLDKVRKSLDEMANGWNREEKDECVKETKATFTQGGSLLSYIARPPADRPKVNA